MVSYSLHKKCVAGFIYPNFLYNGSELERRNETTKMLKPEDVKLRANKKKCFFIV